MLQISLFGELAITRNGSKLEGFRTHKVAALLTILAAEPEIEHRRESLMTLLWPGMPESSARSNLRQVLFHLRQAIPDFDTTGGRIPLLIANRNTIRLNPEAPVSIDTLDFTRLLERVRTHDHFDVFSCQICRNRMSEAADRYTGRFLADFFLDDSIEFENWAEHIRENLRRKLIDILETLTTIALRQGEFFEARTFAERQLEIDDLQERACQQLMEVLARSGQRNEAISVYEQFRRRLNEELGMLPASRTTQLYEKILDGDLQFDTTGSGSLRGYTIHAEIGAGTYGVVYRALQPPIDREVAVKVIRRPYADDPAFIRHFEIEAQTIARLEHPHIVPLYDYWRDPDGAYLVMRLLRGGNLLGALSGGTWSLERTLGFLNQIAPALAIAHEHGIVHRDIKPANILFDEIGNAYLADFGIARTLLPGKFSASKDLPGGSPDYVSPEQLLEEEVSPRSDIYSLGAVLYEILTGEKPFPNRPLAAVIQSHLADPFPRVRDSVPGLPAGVDRVLQRATAKQPTDRFESVLGLAEAFRRAAGGGGQESTVTAVKISSAGVPNPYKGLRAFQQSDAADFFGREALTALLVEHLAEERFLAVVGPSGSGKSSVVKAGVIPALQAGAISGSDRWFVAEMVPGSRPMEELAQALWPIAVDPPPDLVEPMARDTQGILRTVRRVLPQQGSSQLLLVIDQFEELWSMTSKARRHEFLEGLLAAVRAPRSPLRVIVTLRADFYDRPLQQPLLAALFKDHTILALPMSREEITWAIREPAERLGVIYDEGVLAAIVADVHDQPGVLPLLQYALTQLFENRSNGRISSEAYDVIGGVPGALTRKAEEIYQALSPEDQEITRQIFLRLVVIGDTAMEGGRTPDTRRRVLVHELEGLTSTARQEDGAARVNTVLELFGKARLLTFDHDPLTRQPVVEVSHEALLREWERLRGWLESSRDDMRLHRSLVRAREEWAASGMDPDFLLQGARLAQYENWSGQSTLTLTGAEAGFMELSIASRREKQEEEAARQERELETARRLAETERLRAEEGAQAVRRLRSRALFLTFALVAAGVLAVVSIVSGQRAVENEKIAISRELAAAALTSLDADAERSILLALEALSTAHTLQAESMLHESVLQSRVRRTLDVGPELWGVDISPDGRTIALADKSGRLTLWNAGSGELERVIEGHDGYVNAVVYSSDGAWIATAGDDNARVWDLQTGQELFRMESHENFIVGIDVSPDDRFLVTSSWDGTARIWDVESSLKTGVGQEVHTISGHTDWLWKVSFSPDGRHVATASYDGTARIWDVESGTEVMELTIYEETNGAAWVERTLFSPTEDLVVVVGGTATVTEMSFWVRSTGEFLYRLFEHKIVIQNARFSPDGTRFVTASVDGTAIVWDLTGPFPQVLMKLSGHTSWVNDAEFSPDGKILVTASRDGTARIWDISPEGKSEELTFHAPTSWLGAIGYNPDGRRLAGGAEDGTVRIWDLSSGEELVSFSAHEGAVTSVAFHPDGALLATAGEDRLAKIWDPGTGSELHSLSGHGPLRYDWTVEGVLSLAFFPDGSRLVTAGVDGRVIVWDPFTGMQLSNLKAHPEERAATTVAINHDGSLIAAGTDQPGQVTVLDSKTGQTLYSLPAGESSRVWGLAFSPAENLVAFGNNQGLLEMWRLPESPAKGGEPEQLYTIEPAHAAGMTSIRFSPDGTRLLTTGADQTMRLWDPHTGEEVLAINLPVVRALFSPDGRQIAAAGSDELVRLVYWELEDILDLAKSRVTRSLRDDECRQYFHMPQCPGRDP